MERLGPLLTPVAILLSAVVLAVALRPPRYQYAVFQDRLVLRGDTRSGEAVLCRPNRETDRIQFTCWTTLARNPTRLPSNE